MLSMKVAKIAVSKATYWIDRPYDYFIPEEMVPAVKPGVRVKVPYSRSNRESEGIVLGVSDSSEFEKLKSVTAVLDAAPILTEDQLKLALFMREYFFCTVYEAVKAMLPSGLLFGSDGRRKVNDAYLEIASLSVSGEEASDYAGEIRRKSPKQAEILEVLSGFQQLPVKELLSYADASRQSLESLIKKNLLSVEKKEIYRRPKLELQKPQPLPILNDDQNEVYRGIVKKMDSGEASVSLLYGITGSGKTSVYSRLIADCIGRGQGAILLVPEISLTPQMIATFSSYFGDKIAVLHSSLTPSERLDEWKRVNRGDAQIVIGTRSAVFAPVRNLGIIIVDEEQEETYKSENSPRYHAVDIAKYRCWVNHIPLLLGSATPNVVSMYRARNGVYDLFRLTERYSDVPIPEVTVVDMKEELLQGNGSDISRFLASELRRNIDNGEQSIVFLNRRGTHKHVTCPSCGFTYSCPRCSASLTYHSSGNRLICHYCGFSRKVDDRCPDCGGLLDYFGSGTQRIIDELKELFPDTETVRMDADSLSEVGSHEYLFDRFIHDKVPILVGTQMVSKGLNFENVTLVGVISADQSLYSGDYRAAEETFSMLTQVIGRSGRFSKPGRAVIQTFAPENSVIVSASRQNYDAFYDSEIQFRQMQMMPPFSDLLRVTVSGEGEEESFQCARIVAEQLRKELSHEQFSNILGPAPLPLAKLNNRYRFGITVACHSDKRIRQTVSSVVVWANREKRFSKMNIFADNNPL